MNIIIFVKKIIIKNVLRAGTSLNTLDNHGRTPLQLAQSKLKLLQKSSSQTDGMSRVRYFTIFFIDKLNPWLQVKAEVNSILEMMTEYLKRVSENSCSYEHLIQSFSQVNKSVFEWLNIFNYTWSMIIKLLTLIEANFNDCKIFFSGCMSTPATLSSPVTSALSSMISPAWLCTSQSNYHKTHCSCYHDWT